MSKTIELTNAQIIVLLAAIYDAKQRMREQELLQVHYMNNLEAIAQRLADLNPIFGWEKETYNDPAL